MLEELIKEMNELVDYKKKYEHAMADKQKMSDMLYEYMMKEYERTPYEERCKTYIEKHCSMCRLRGYCDRKHNLSKDIMMPVPSDKAWIPAQKGCSMFEWS